MLVLIQNANGGQTIIGTSAGVRGSNSYDCVVIGKYQYIANLKRSVRSDRLKIGADNTTWIEGAILVKFLEILTIHLMKI